MTTKAHRDPVDRMMEEAVRREVELRRRIDERAREVVLFLRRHGSVGLASLLNESVAQIQRGIGKAPGRVGGDC